MFKKVLSKKLLKIIDEQNITIEKLAEMSDMSRKFLGNIISEKQTPTISSLEKLCSALALTPNELLISETSLSMEENHPLEIKEILCRIKNGKTVYSPICPKCHISLNEDLQAYCDICGQRLSWKDYSRAHIIHLDK